MPSRSIDLHDLTVSEAMAEFVRRYNEIFESGYRGRIEVIHGYGSSGVGGAIRQRLRGFLGSNSDRFEQVTHGESVGNPGVTYVYPKGRLPTPTPRSAVAAGVIAFCSTPKSESRIVAKLVGRYGDPAVRSAIRDLVRSGALEAVRSGVETKYIAR